MRFCTIFFLAQAACVLSKPAAVLERFDDGWEQRWTFSTRDSRRTGRLRSLGPGLATLDDLRWYRLSTLPSPRPFSNARGESLVVQLAMAWRKPVGCGSVFVVLAPEVDSKQGGKRIKQKNWSGRDQYSIMFGPEMCAAEVHHVVTNLYYKGNVSTGPLVNTVEDNHMHVYTLVLRPDNSYSVKIDNVEVSGGQLADEWELLGPKMVADVEEKQPSHEVWDDRQVVPNPDWKPPPGTPPPSTIPDPDAQQPRNWNTKKKGKWTPPLVANPEYYEHWVRPIIANVNYQGPWEPRMVPNPEIVGKKDDNLYMLAGNVSIVGVEAWLEHAGAEIHHVFVSTSEEDAEQLTRKLLREEKEGIRSGGKVQHHDEL